MSKIFISINKARLMLFNSCNWLILFLSALEPDEFRCLIPVCNETSESHDEFLHFGYDIFPIDEDKNVDFCKRYPVKENLPYPLKCTLDDFDMNAPENKLVLCTPDQDIIYGDFGMDWTVATRFNLVCDAEYKVKT